MSILQLQQDKGSTKTKKKALVVELPRITHLWRHLSSTDTMHPKSELHRAGSIGHTPRESPNVHIFSIGSNNENELYCLVHFIHLEFLKIVLLHYQSQSAEY